MSDTGKTAVRPDYASLCTFEIARGTEHAAIAASRFTGRGDEMGGELAALAAMAGQLQQLPMCCKVVIGESDYSESGLLEVGSLVGKGDEHRADLAVMPLEGTSVNARALSNALSVIVMAEKDGLLALPSIYMEKIAIGPGYEDGLVSLEASPGENIERLARAKGVSPQSVTVCILDRARHSELIAKVREAGAAIRLIGDGDIAGVIQTTNPDETGIDIYMGIGGADQGILAAAALQCMGGQIEGRLYPRNPDERKLMEKYGIEDPRRIYRLSDMISGDVTFAATGVTDGYMLDGVRLTDDAASSQSIVMRASSGVIRTIDTLHTHLPEV